MSSSEWDVYFCFYLIFFGACAFAGVIILILGRLVHSF